MVVQHQAKEILLVSNSHKTLPEAVVKILVIKEEEAANEVVAGVVSVVEEVVVVVEEVVVEVASKAAQVHSNASLLHNLVAALEPTAILHTLPALTILSLPKPRASMVEDSNSNNLAQDSKVSSCHRCRVNSSKCPSNQVTNLNPTLVAREHADLVRSAKSWPVGPALSITPMTSQEPWVASHSSNNLAWVARHPNLDKMCKLRDNKEERAITLNVDSVLL